MLSGRGSHSLPDDNHQAQTELTSSIKQDNSQMIVFCNFVEEHKQEESKGRCVCISCCTQERLCSAVMGPGPLLSSSEAKVKDQQMPRCLQADNEANPAPPVLPRFVQPASFLSAFDFPSE